MVCDKTSLKCNNLFLSFSAALCYNPVLRPSYDAQGGSFNHAAYCVHHIFHHSVLLRGLLASILPRRPGARAQPLSGYRASAPPHQRLLPRQIGINSPLSLDLFPIIRYTEEAILYAGVVELADARDSKSRVRKDVRVRPPPPAPRKKPSKCWVFLFFPFIFYIF